MGVPTAAGKCHVKAVSPTKDARLTSRTQLRRATFLRKQKGRCYRPFCNCAGHAVDASSFSPSKRRTGVQRQRPVEGLVDVLRVTIRGRVEVRQNGPELRR